MLFRSGDAVDPLNQFRECHAAWRMLGGERLALDCDNVVDWRVFEKDVLVEEMECHILVLENVARTVVGKGS